MGIDVFLEFLSGFGELIFEFEAAGDLFRVFDQRQVIRPLRAREHAIETVIVAHRDRVVLVVVTAGAGNGQSQESARHGIDLIVDLIMRVVVEQPPEREEAECRQAPGRDCWVHEVRGQLVVNKLVEGQVLIEGADDVVAVGVCVGTQRILPVQQHQVFRIRVTGQVEPMASPPLAVAGRTQQLIHDSGERARRRVAL